MSAVAACPQIQGEMKGRQVNWRPSSVLITRISINITSISANSLSKRAKTSGAGACPSAEPCRSFACRAKHLRTSTAAANSAPKDIATSKTITTIMLRMRDIFLQIRPDKPKL
ncbi:MAG TPA: hypothetical protein VMU18_13610 [Rhodoblastus sp.]|nr:hypothetical protein [Rhodoblastus sp.]